MAAVLVVLTGVGLFWPLLPGSSKAAPVETDSTISRYEATYRVDADGRVSATETLFVDLPAGRHGLFRFLPVADPTNPHARRVPHATGATIDGQPAAMHREWRDGRRVLVLRIGDRHTTLTPGRHRVDLGYTVDGGLVAAPDAPGQFSTVAGSGGGESTYYWNVVGFWTMRILGSEVHLHLPEPSTTVRCSAGEPACEITGAGTRDVTVRTGELPAWNPVTVRADVAVAVPPRAELPWTERFDPVVGRSAPFAQLMAAATLLCALLGWTWVRRSRERPPASPLRYAPPDGLGPAQLAYIVDETVGEQALSATLLHLADRELVRLDRAESGWRITGTGGSWERLDPVSRRVGEALGLDVADATLQVPGDSRLGAGQRAVEDGCRCWAEAAGLTRQSRVERLGTRLVFASVLPAILGFSGVLGATVWGLPFAAFTITGLPLLSPGVGSRRRDAGRRVWSAAAGFRRLLATPSAEDRFDYAARKDLFISYIPYAMAFGVADAWAAKYRAATGTEPPAPSWYPGYTNDSGVQVYAMAGGFTAAVASAVGAYRASAAASGGGGFSSGGGGFGGGGGGGGGTW